MGLGFWSFGIGVTEGIVFGNPKRGFKVQAQLSQREKGVRRCARTK